jgi:hypothetical protein
MINYQNVLPNYVEAYQNDLTRATRITPLIRLLKITAFRCPAKTTQPESFSLPDV